MNHEVTKTERFVYHRDKAMVAIQYSDTTSGWYWRLVVNGDEGPWYNSTYNLIAHHGYAAVSEYWAHPDLEPWYPFRLDYAGRLQP